MTPPLRPLPNATMTNPHSPKQQIQTPPGRRRVIRTCKNLPVLLACSEQRYRRGPAPLPRRGSRQQQINRTLLNQTRTFTQPRLSWRLFQSLSLPLLLSLSSLFSPSLSGPLQTGSLSRLSSRDPLSCTTKYDESVKDGRGSFKAQTKHCGQVRLQGGAAG